MHTRTIRDVATIFRDDSLLSLDNCRGVLRNLTLKVAVEKGQQPLAIWVKGFGKAVLERHKQYGLRIVQVEYLAGDRVLGQLTGKPTKAWKLDTFLHNVPALSRGTHKLRARVQLVAPGVKTGELTPTETILSAEMTVTIRDIFAAWMEAAASIAEKNLIRGVRFTATATSAKNTAKLAIDGRESTQWVCGTADPAPSVTFELKKLVTAKNVVIAQAGSRMADLGVYDRITVIEVRINREKPLRVELDKDPLGVTTVALGKARRVRTLQLRILERVPGKRRGQAGFTEVALTR